jgi:hypothetical protein
VIREITFFVIRRLYGTGEADLVAQLPDPLANQLIAKRLPDTGNPMRIPLGPSFSLVC